MLEILTEMFLMGGEGVSLIGLAWNLSLPHTWVLSVLYAQCSIIIRLNPCAPKL